MTHERAKNCHDGKWLIELNDVSLMEDVKKQLLIQKEPNRK